jgi:hypothetical protein
MSITSAGQPSCQRFAAINTDLLVFLVILGDQFPILFRKTAQTFSQSDQPQIVILLLMRWGTASADNSSIYARLLSGCFRYSIKRLPASGLSLFWLSCSSLLIVNLRWKGGRIRPVGRVRVYANNWCGLNRLQKRRRPAPSCGASAVYQCGNLRTHFNRVSAIC